MQTNHLKCGIYVRFLELSSRIIEIHTRIRIAVYPGTHIVTNTCGCHENQHMRIFPILVFRKYNNHHFSTQAVMREQSPLTSSVNASQGLQNLQMVESLIAKEAAKLEKELKIQSRYS